MSDLDDVPDEEVAQGVRDFILFLEECDSTIVDDPWNRIMRGSLLLYDFSKGKRDE